MSDDFYIGYQKKAPTATARLIRGTIILLGLTILCGAALAGLLQHPADDGTFEFGVTREFRGTLLESPFPHFAFAENVEGTSFVAGDRAVLVAFGKFGMPESLREGLGKSVTLRGSLIYRDTVAMIELATEDPMTIIGDGASENFNTISPKTVTLTGELVDTKCYLGVMRPGEGKVHRACASVCLRGGIPPGLLVRGENGAAVWFLVDPATGEPLTIDPELAGRALTVSGEAALFDNLPTLNVVSWEVAR